MSFTTICIETFIFSISRTLLFLAVIFAGYFLRFNITRCSSLKLSNLFFIMLQVSVLHNMTVRYYTFERNIRARAWSPHELPVYGEFLHFTTAWMAVLISVDAVSLATRRLYEKERKRRKRGKKHMPLIGFVFLGRCEDLLVAETLFAICQMTTCDVSSCRWNKQ